MKNMTDMQRQYLQMLKEEEKEIKDSRYMVDDHNWRDRNRTDHFTAGEYCVRNRTKEK